MKQFIIIGIDDDDINVTVRNPDPILVDVGQVQLRTGDSGGGNSSNSRVFNFTNADLSQTGAITFVHNLDLTFVDISVYSPVIGEITPDSVITAYNSITINLLNFMPITGIWTVLVEV
jgi:hypothetical protein